MNYTIYHNPRCSKSRAGLEFLNDKKLNFEIVDYLKTGLDAAELKLLFAKIGKSPKEMIRTHEEIFKTQFAGKNFTDDEWIQIIAENPKLLQRPIVVRGNKGVLANPIENLIDFL